LVYLEQADGEYSKKKKKKKKKKKTGESLYGRKHKGTETGLDLASNPRPTSYKAKEDDKPCRPIEVKGIKSSHPPQG
jgi:hypothetical protein